MTYYVIGLMSGSSLDGLDILHTSITYVSGKWEYEILHQECVRFNPEMKNNLRNAALLSVPDFLRLDTAFAKFSAEEVNRFIEKHDLTYKIHLISSHGHTVWHEPSTGVSTQIGDGATIAALTGYPTVSDLRNMDVALGGQGAPIVPVADRLLFSEYDYCLNLGGIANITINSTDLVAFDICPANQILNFFAEKKGLEFDDHGEIAKTGQVNEAILKELNRLEFYKKTDTKSLDNQFAKENIIPLLESESTENALATAVKHIAFQIKNSISAFHDPRSEGKMLITGGGALNSFLIQQIEQALDEEGLKIELTIPEDELVYQKESLAMALIGVLRWREEPNVFNSVSGAKRNSIG